MLVETFRKNLVFALAVFFALALPSLAAAQASDSGDITVEIQNQAITLSSDSVLSFGTVLPFGRNGSVTVNPFNGVASGSNAFVSAPGNNASWSVTGVPGAFYAITLPSDGAVTVTSGANQMAVNDFTHSRGNAPRLDATGADAFGVGARLFVDANQASGTYAGTYNVTVSYN